jgi:hypothetical protein
MNDVSSFVSMQAFPRVPVRHATDSYFVFTKDDMLGTWAKKRAPGAAAAVGGVNVSTATYTCLREALAYRINDPQRANADDPLDLDRLAVEHIAQQLRLAVEADFASTVFATSTWTGSSTGSDLTASPTWDDVASTPIEDVRAQSESILEKNGIAPNTMVLGHQVFRRLLDHPDVIDRIKYGQTPGAPALANEQILAQLFGLDRVLVAKSTRNSALEQATGSYDFQLNQLRALLMYSAPSPSIMAPSAGYTFVWNDGDRSNGIEGVKRYRDEVHECDVVEGGIWFDFKVVAGSLGAFWSTATA